MDRVHRAAVILRCRPTNAFLQRFCAPLFYMFIIILYAGCHDDVHIHNCSVSFHSRPVTELVNPQLELV